ncbi:hypothetical protein N7536_009024, partial [Penicillium majusculum]
YNLRIIKRRSIVEPISIASGLVALATFTFQSSIALFDSVQSYQSYLKRVYDLIEELETLNRVLSALREIVNANTDINLASLGYPLLRYRNTYKDFKEELKKYSTRSSAADSLESYKEIIETTTDDLETYLEGIDEKLKKIIAKNTRDSNTDTREIQLIEEERLSTQKCLEIYTQFNNYEKLVITLPNLSVRAAY